MNLSQTHPNPPNCRYPIRPSPMNLNRSRPNPNCRSLSHRNSSHWSQTSCRYPTNCRYRNSHCLHYCYRPRWNNLRY